MIQWFIIGEAIKGTLIQIWKFTFVFIFIEKQYTENLVLAQAAKQSFPSKNGSCGFFTCENIILKLALWYGNIYFGAKE